MGLRLLTLTRPLARPPSPEGEGDALSHREKVAA